MARMVPERCIVAIINEPARRRFGTISLCLVALTAPSAGEMAADLVLRGGTIHTVDDSRPRAEALTVRAGRLIAVGSDHEISAYIGETTEILDLDGDVAIPGFIEAHGHFPGLGQARLQLDLRQAANWEDIVALERDAVAVAGPGELISGRGWHREKWERQPELAVDGLPHHHSLSAVSPEHPVLLCHANDHATFANARAMAQAVIDAATPDPEGGQIVRDEQGRPIGMFREKAVELLAPVRRSAPPPDLRRVSRHRAGRGIPQGHHDVSGRRVVLRRHRLVAGNDRCR